MIWFNLPHLWSFLSAVTAVPHERAEHLFCAEKIVCIPLSGLGECDYVVSGKVETFQKIFNVIAILYSWRLCLLCLASLSCIVSLELDSLQALRCTKSLRRRDRLGSSTISGVMRLCKMVE